MSEKRAIVVGAGLSGATVARTLAEGGVKVTVWEKEKYVGGAISDYRKDDYFVQRHGPHLFHTSSEAACAFLSRFTEWFDYRHTVRAHITSKYIDRYTLSTDIKDKYIPVPFNFTSLEALYPADKAKKIESALVGKYGADAAVSISELRLNPDPEIKEFAEFVYVTVFKYYSFKQWGLDMAAIDPAVFKRVPVRTGYIDGYFADKYQAMPKDGFSAIIENMLKNENITVKTGVDAISRLAVKDGKLEIDGKPADCPVIFTGCIDELCGDRFGRLPYRTLRFDLKEENTPSFQPYGVVNYTVTEPFTRISEFKKFTVENSKAKTSVTVREYPRSYDRESELSPYYPMPTADAKESYAKYAEYVKDIKNLYFAGRLGSYVYVNMDKAVDRALDLGKHLLETAFAAK